ncbi:MAG: hypothetical protein V7641_1552 [Blastocatellia bacterium]
MIMSRRSALLFLSSVFFLSGAQGLAQTRAALSPDEALKRAIANEAQLKLAESNFTYRQEILVQAIGEAGTVRAQLHRVSEVTYDDLGKRVEKILEYPPSNLVAALGLLQVDFKNLLGVEPFFLTTTTLPLYAVKFVERQKLDELQTLVFALQPADAKTAAQLRDKGEHLFAGKVWIDEQDYEIVKIEGRAVTVKEDRARFPKFECYRENVDSGIWLPAMVMADDVLDFPRYDLPVRMKINYSNFKRVKNKK